MRTMFEHKIMRVRRAMRLLRGDTVFSGPSLTRDLRGATSSLPPRNGGISSLNSLLSEPLKTNCTALIMVPVDPGQPVAYTVEPENGSLHWRQLTARYAPSPDDSARPTLKFVGCGSATPTSVQHDS